MNFNELAENVGLREDEFLELVELFVETGMSDLNKLQCAILEGDADKAASAAHSIKGAAGNLGFQEIYEVAKRIEEKARENSLEGATEAVRRIRQKCDLIAEVLREKLVE